MHSSLQPAACCGAGQSGLWALFHHSTLTRTWPVGVHFELTVQGPQQAVPRQPPHVTQAGAAVALPAAACPAAAQA